MPIRARVAGLGTMRQQRTKLMPKVRGSATSVDLPKTTNNGSAPAMSAKSIVFVDSRVDNYQLLIASLTDTHEVYVLDGDANGLEQMAHKAINSANLNIYRPQLQGIGRMLDPNMCRPLKRRDFR